MSDDSTERGRTSILGQGRFLRLLDLDGWEFVQRRRCSGVAALVALTDEGQLLLVEQFRPPVGRRVIELPAGLVGDLAEQRDESLLAAAQRELIEETGFQAARLTELVRAPSSAGLSDEVITFLQATGLTRVGPGGGDTTEQIEVHALPLEQVPSWLEERAREGSIIDLKVYVGLYFARYAVGLD